MSLIVTDLRTAAYGIPLAISQQHFFNVAAPDRISPASDEPYCG
jgi:hypothetical protein